MLPELLGNAGLVLREEHDEDAEGVGDAVLHDAGGDIARGQECAACFGGFAGGKEQGALSVRAELLFEEGGKLRGTMRKSAGVGCENQRRQSLTFLMLVCMKKRGYPVCIASKTRASPSSYATLSAHFGSETDTACSVKAGIGLPRGFCRAGIVLRVKIRCDTRDSVLMGDPKVRYYSSFTIYHDMRISLASAGLGK